MPNDKWDVQEQIKQVVLPKRKGIHSMGPKEKPLPPMTDFSEKTFDEHGKYIPQKVRDAERKRALRENILHPKRRKLFGRF